MLEYVISMKNFQEGLSSTQGPQLEIVAQRPDLDIQEVRGPSDEIIMTREEFPWLSSAKACLPLTELVLIDQGQAIRYGSAVSENGTLKRLASRVNEQGSISAERSMFKALPAILKNETAANVNAVTVAQGSASVLKTTKRGNNIPRIFFTLLERDSDKPIVVKLAVANHKDQQQVYSVLTGSKLQRKKDG